MSTNKYVQKSASALISAQRGDLLGIFVSSSSSGTLKAWDSTSAAGTVIFDTTDTITAPTFLACPVEFGNAADGTGGLFITVGGTISYTVVFRHR